MIESSVIIMVFVYTAVIGYRLYLYLLVNTDLYYWLDKFKSPSRGVYTVNWTIKELIALYDVNNANRWYICRTRLSKSVVLSLLCAVGILRLVCVEFTSKTDGTIHTSYLLVSIFSPYGDYCDKIDYHIFDTCMPINCNKDHQFSVSKITNI